MIGALSQDYLDLSLVDDDGRELEIITPWKGSSNSYKDYNDSDICITCSVIGRCKEELRIICYHHIIITIVIIIIIDYYHHNFKLYLFLSTTHLYMYIYTCS